MAERATPPIRGRRGRDRRLAEQVASTLAARHRPLADEDAIDFDLAAVDAEAEDARRAEARGDARVRRPAPRRRAAAERSDLDAPPTAGPRLAPAAAGGDGVVRVAARAAGQPRRRSRAGWAAMPGSSRCRTARSRISPRRSRSRTPVSGWSWIARDAEIGDRVAEELGAWLGDPEAVVVLEPRTALAYERSELVADETAARVAALAAWRSGRARVLVAGVQALLQHTLVPDDLPAEPRTLRRGVRLHQDALLRDLLELGYVPVLEVAGRGEFAQRGGIVDVFPPSLPLPIRIEFFGDEIDSLRAFDPTDQRTVRLGRRRRAPARVGVPAARPAAPRPSAAGLGRAAARLPERLDADLARFEGAEDERLGARHGRAAGGRHARDGRRRRGRGLGGLPGAGDRARPPRPGHAARPRRARRHRRGGRVPLAPGRRAARRTDRGRRAAEGLAVDLSAVEGLEGPG